RVNPKILSAWLTLFPRTVSTTIRTLRGEMRMCVALAFMATFLYAISLLVLSAISVLLYACSYRYGPGNSAPVKILPACVLPRFQLHTLAQIFYHYAPQSYVPPSPGESSSVVTTSE